MNDDLTPSYEHETGQVILEGRPGGPAGEGRLTPVTGLELAFDLMDGHLVQAIVADAEAPTTTLLIRLFGPSAPAMVRTTTRRDEVGVATLMPEATLCAALSALARLQAARATSPVSGSSPWWEVEAAVLAEQAGLHSRAVAAARRAISALDNDRGAVPAEAARMALAAADILSDSDGEAARRLRDGIAVLSETRQSQLPGLDVAAEVEDMEKDCVRLPGLHWMLDPGLAPGAPFRPGLSPYSDLAVRQEACTGRLLVSAMLTSGAPHEAVGMWCARLVDPVVRRILAVASFEQAGSRAQAKLRLPFPLDELSEAWIEVTDHSDRPVRSAKLHRMRRALRWADAALRAERAPAGLAPRSASTDWAALAAAAWERCRRDWEAADDMRRAAAAAAPRVARPGPACLAEVLGE
jgi:hypothetical protein